MALPSIMVVTTGFAAQGAFAQTETIRVELKLYSGGEISGLVVDHTSHGIVIVHEDTPHVFAWGEIKTPSAYVAKRDLLALLRGGLEALSAEDRFELGLFALSRGSTGLASKEFRRAGELDDTFRQRAKDAFDRFRRERQTTGTESRVPSPGDEGSSTAGTVDAADRMPGLSERIGRALEEGEGNALVDRGDPETRARVLETYRSFGETVRRELGGTIVLVETEHFLIWTDFPARERERLGEMCEAMYDALCAQFGIASSETVFLAKCPIFCWASKKRFVRFARLFDGHDARNAVGYTRSIEQSGHVHVALLKRGRGEADLDRFACTLVHEGTHAFLHRLHSTRLIPHWVNEGIAERVAEGVLGDRCPNAENAALLAEQYVRYDWSIRPLLQRAGAIGVHEYPLAHSVVRFLGELDADRFAAFIRELKQGKTTSEALAAAYDGLTLSRLETRWRDAVRERTAKSREPGGRRPVFDWPG